VDGWSLDAAGRAVLGVRVASPPADGAANEAVIRLIAKALRRPKPAVRIVGGHSARLKRLEIEGAESGDIALAFGPPPGEA
jgi:uncharacterized protein YggU (UPF0235/DUF167 family)